MEQYSLYTPNEIWERIIKTFPNGIEHPGNNHLNKIYNNLLNDLREAAAWGYYQALIQKENLYTYSVFRKSDQFVLFITNRGFKVNDITTMKGYINIVSYVPINLKKLLDDFNEYQTRETKENSSIRVLKFSGHHSDDKEESSYSFKTNKKIPEESYVHLCDAIAAVINKDQSTQP